MEPENKPATKPVDSTLDDLLSNPFGTDSLTPFNNKKFPTCSRKNKQTA
ncbi:MAG: hypothetical protein ACLRPU_05925 [Enterococcus hulanensis]